MVVRPRSEIWRSVAHTFGHDPDSELFVSRWIRHLRGWWFRTRDPQPGIDAPHPGWLWTTTVAPTSRLVTATLDWLMPGGRAMIFRKENRSESFQRQISSLRQQLQTETESQTDEFRHSESQDTSQFSASAREGRETADVTIAASRPTDTSGTTQITTATTAGTTPRGTWQTPDTNTSVIAGNAHWNGTLRTEGSLHVHGRAEGELHATHDLYVAEGAQVDAGIFADNVVVAGLVRGTIEARTRLEVLPQGHVSGDVKAPKLVVHEGARLSGKLTMEGTGAVQYWTSSQSTKSRRSGR